MTQGEPDLLYEASFVWGRLFARADALRRSPGGWTLIEIKFGLSPKEEYPGDLADTVCVAGEAGLHIVGAALVLINREYRLSGDAQSSESPTWSGRTASTSRDPRTYRSRVRPSKREWHVELDDVVGLFRHGIVESAGVGQTRPQPVLAPPL